MDNISITERLADFALSIKYDELPKEVIEQAKLCLSDFLGCVIGAYKTPEAEIIRSLVMEEESRPDAYIPGSWEKTSMLNAALATGYLGHIYEMDDVYTPASLHPGNPVISAALPVAIKYGCSGKALIEAIVAGYEVIDRIGECVFPSHYECWHSTATCGCFASAVSAGLLLKLNREQLVWAMGNAGTQAAGLWQFSDDSAMSKYLHCGKAAYNGLLSAMLAKKNYTGARRILEGNRGFIRGASREKPPFHAFDGLGDGSFRIMLNGFKPYPSCGFTHTAICAATELYKKYHFSPDEIESVLVEVNNNAAAVACKNGYVDHPREAKFSLRYTVASALKNGVVTNDSIGAGALADAAFQEFATKVDVCTNDELTANFPRLFTSIVHLTAKDGKEYVQRTDYAKGSPQVPLSKEELRDKYMGLILGVASAEFAEDLYNRCETVDSMDSMSSFFDFEA